MSTREAEPEQKTKGVWDQPGPGSWIEPREVHGKGAERALTESRQTPINRVGPSLRAGNPATQRCDKGEPKPTCHRLRVYLGGFSLSRYHPPRGVELSLLLEMRKPQETNGGATGALCRRSAKRTSQWLNMSHSL